MSIKMQTLSFKDKSTIRDRRLVGDDANVSEFKLDLQKAQCTDAFG